MCRQLPVHAPGAALGTREVRVYGLAADFESVAHARQQSVDLVIAEIDCAAQKLADAGLSDTTDSRELRLARPGCSHDVAKDVAGTHDQTIAFYAIDLAAQSRQSVGCECPDSPKGSTRCPIDIGKCRTLAPSEPKASFLSVQLRNCVRGGTWPSATRVVIWELGR